MAVPIHGLWFIRGKFLLENSADDRCQPVDYIQEYPTAGTPADRRRSTPSQRTQVLGDESISCRLFRVRRDFTALAVWEIQRFFVMGQKENQSFGEVVYEDSP